MKMVRYLNQQQAINIDLELFNNYKFSVDQLMELAGLSCATAVRRSYRTAKQVLVCCGPGNNGGDGLVAARHLKLFGMHPTVYYQRQPDKTLYKNLAHQCVSMDIEVDAVCPSLDKINNYDVIVDALFGFSFKPPVRPEFSDIMAHLGETRVPICSVDVPSGWDIDHGKGESKISPDSLVSLTSPKLCAKDFTGRYHYLGGRFVPPSLALKYDLQLPEYSDTDCVILLNNIS